MADEPIVPVEQPVVLAPVEAPVAPPVEAPAVPAEPVAAPETTPAEPPVKAEPSLLESIEAPKAPDPEKPAELVEAKPDEKKPEEVPKADEVKTEAKPDAPAEPVKPEPVEYKYEVPEAITMPEERRAELHQAFDAFRVDPNAGAQQLMELHAKAMTDYDTHLRQEQFRVFGETKANWRTQAMADEQIGGAAWQTSSQAIARMRDQFVSASARGTDSYNADRANFIEMLTLTGAGDHPAMLKFLHNVAQRFDEPAVPVISDVRPVPDRGPKGNPLHDNPRSQNLNGRG